MLRHMFLFLFFIVLCETSSVKPKVHTDELPVLGESIRLVCSYPHGSNAPDALVGWGNENDVSLAKCIGTKCTLMGSPLKYEVLSNGKSSSTLTIRNLTSADGSHYYWCKALTTFGNLDSDKINFTILTPSEYKLKKEIIMFL